MKKTLKKRRTDVIDSTKLVLCIGTCNSFIFFFDNDKILFLEQITEKNVLTSFTCIPNYIALVL